MKPLKIILTLLLAAQFCVNALAQNPRMSTIEYISTYKDAAMQEMRESKVPASITLAQGILESSSGNSRLAKEGNNHFGIKCKKSWTGKTIFEDDDELHECFRAYDSALNSYRDHSQFLKKNRRYSSLFSLNIYNYKGWAKGLRKAGYATNKRYAVMLIDLIERYSLNKFDTLALNSTNIIVDKTDITKIDTVPVVQNTDEDKWKVYGHKGGNESLIISIKDEIELNHLITKSLFNSAFNNESIWEHFNLESDSDQNTNNKVELYSNFSDAERNLIHEVIKGETLLSISSKYDVLPDEIRKWNNLPVETVSIGQSLIIHKNSSNNNTVNDDHLIIEELPENVESDVNPRIHIVKNGESLYSIAKQHNISLSDLKSANYLTKDEISLNQKLVIPVSKTSSVIDYYVKKNDTLYSIATKHKVTVNELKKWNLLKGNTIKKGQLLKVKKSTK